MRPNSLSKHADLTAGEARAIVEAVTAALGPDWTAGPVHRDGDQQPMPYHRTPITHRDGYGFDLTFDGYRNEGRIEVSANYPKSRDGRELYPYGGQYDPRASAITVSRETPPAKIAKQIQSRFLPGYLPIWRKQVERRDGQNQYTDQTEAGIAAILAQEHEPGAARRASHGDRTAIWLSNSYAGTVTPQGDSVRFEHLSVPLEVALELLKVLRKPAPQIQPMTDEAFEQHRQDDPHCTCNDCLDYREAQMQAAEREREAEEAQRAQEDGTRPLHAG